MRMSHAQWSFSRWLSCLLVLAALAGCTTAKLVGDYDEQIDKGTTALQKDVDAFLEKLEASAATQKDNVATYDQHKQFYSDARVAVNGLRVRADATERNSLTVRSFDKLHENINLLEEMHKKGITRAEVSKLIRPAFTQQFTAILTFELAKRRGEKPDETKASAPPTPTPAQPTAGGNK